ncbi:MAG: polymorphic toxin-type HINT domain-containing protein [Planctomycetaceae bacterium]
MVAWGRIDGSITASLSIGSVRSADLIGTNITAPSVGSVISNDGTVVTQYPMPTVPDSVLPELLQWRADVLANWQQQTDAILLAVANTKTSVAEAITALRNLLAQQKAELLYAGVQLGDELQQSRDDGEASLKASIDSARNTSLENDKLIRSEANQQLNAAAQQKWQMIQAGNAAYNDSVAESTRLAAEFRKAIEDLKTQLIEMRDEFNKDALIDQDWVQQCVNQLGQMAKGMIPGYGTYQKWLEVNDRYVEAIENEMEINRFAFVSANMFPILSDVIRHGFRVYDGRDPWTLEKISTFDRILSGIEVIKGLAEAVTIGLNVSSLFKNPCGSFFSPCFVGNTKVLVARLPQGSMIAFAGAAGAEEPDDVSLGAMCLLIGMGCAVTAYAVGNQIPKEPRRRKRRWNDSMIDDLFSDDDSLNLLDDHYCDEEEVPRRAAGRQPSESFVPHQPPGASLRFASPAFGESHEFNAEVAEQRGETTTAVLTAPVRHESTIRRAAGVNRLMTSSSNRELQTSNNSEPQTLKTKHSRSFLTRGLAVVAAVLLTVGGVLSLKIDSKTQPQPMMAAVDVGARETSATPQYLTKTIAEIQPIADRVLADNPETEGQTPSDFGEFHAADWRLLQLLIPKPDGEWLKVTLARPLSWIEAAERDPDGRLWLEFEELGIANWADVVAIELCREAPLGEGRLVTGKFEHSSADVIDLHIAGLNEPIGTTSNHPFWSEDRQEFVQAGTLTVGEHLRLENGDTTTVFAMQRRAGSVPVFNLEVDGEHVYYVSDAGVLVHNAGRSYSLDRDPNFLGAKRFGYNPHHLIPINTAKYADLRLFFERAAAKGWNMNGRRNGMWLDEFTQHRGRHDLYSDYVANRIRSYIDTKGGIRAIGGADARKYLDGLSDDLRRRINFHPDEDINFLF